MFNDIEVNGKDGRNSAGPRRNLQGGGAFGAIIWHQDLGDDRGDAQSPDGVSSLGGMTERRDDGEAQDGRRVGVLIGR